MSVFERRRVADRRESHNRHAVFTKIASSLGFARISRESEREMLFSVPMKARQEQFACGTLNVDQNTCQSQNINW